MLFQGIPNDKWTICTLNEGYELCPTYPKVLVVPSSANRTLIEGCAKFRAKGRLPVLTFLHPDSKAAIIRCAQPMVGITGLRNDHDEEYMEHLRVATQGMRTIQVVDTRPSINAMANKASGKGYESEKYYRNMSFTFSGIENIHTMRKSLSKLVAAVGMVPSKGVEDFCQDLITSGWLGHVKRVLDTSILIAGKICSGTSVVVHCSDGWDRTSQTCALAALLIDPFYRTAQGFQALVEKDFLSFGHKFSDRCGHYEPETPSGQDETSPTFTQFLDCVYQLTLLYPQAFEFNERYLIDIQEHVYSCMYGTFVGNCAKEREELQLSSKTYSLWGHFIMNMDEYKNPLYEPADEAGGLPAPLMPDIRIQTVQFWSNLYARFESGRCHRLFVIPISNS